MARVGAVRIKVPRERCAVLCESKPRVQSQASCFCAAGCCAGCTSHGAAVFATRGRGGAHARLATLESPATRHLGDSVTDASSKLTTTAPPTRPTRRPRRRPYGPPRWPSPHHHARPSHRFCSPLVRPRPSVAPRPRVTPSPHGEQFSIKVLFRHPKVHRMHHVTPDVTPQKRSNRPVRATLAL